MKGRVVYHVRSRVQGVRDVDLFRTLPRARKFLRALRENTELSCAKKGSKLSIHRGDLRGRGHGQYLVLERSALLAEISGNGVSSQTVRNPRAAGDRGAADTVQGSCLGGGQWPGGQRQVLHERNLRGAGPMLKPW